ncbi:hypothetical protein M430DRAFT_15746 [Amorphotheca resinae ATCC 22711]|uniref:Secreted protein n=1 Tax=Amorphotheca resinae ATCC 22711 TaxID=857342 RepID=A0A2T3B9J5_AMORE|nr:hypothetical protein M430DRAFT_15746 [Amorphotheca resinae ATCC 22711]PSS24993.1 hypothetical protein M430DRAFT_15746 [Amorphotheca resinae ATCC 22711]
MLWCFLASGGLSAPAWWGETTTSLENGYSTSRSVLPSKEPWASPSGLVRSDFGLSEVPNRSSSFSSLSSSQHVPALGLDRDSGDGKETSVMDVLIV